MDENLIKKIIVFQTMTLSITAFVVAIISVLK